MFDRRSVVKSLLALGAGRRAAALPVPPAAPAAKRPVARVPAVVRETEAFVFVPGTGTEPSHHAVLLFTEHDDGSWFVEENPTEDSCDALLYLSTRRTADDALSGLLGMVRGTPPPRAEPVPEVAVEHHTDGLALIHLCPEEGATFAKTAPIKVARVNGVWTIIPLGAMRAALEGRFGAGTVPTPAPSRSAFAAD